MLKHVAKWTMILGAVMLAVPVVRKLAVGLYLSIMSMVQTPLASQWEQYAGHWHKYPYLTLWLHGCLVLAIGILLNLIWSLIEAKRKEREGDPDAYDLHEDYICPFASDCTNKNCAHHEPHGCTAGCNMKHIEREGGVKSADIPCHHQTCCVEIVRGGRQ